MGDIKATIKKEKDKEYDSKEELLKSCPRN
jgi:hypothetical protein